MVAKKFLWLRAFMCIFGALCLFSTFKSALCTDSLIHGSILPIFSWGFFEGAFSENLLFFRREKKSLLKRHVEKNAVLGTSHNPMGDFAVHQLVSLTVVAKKNLNSLWNFVQSVPRCFLFLIPFGKSDSSWFLNGFVQCTRWDPFSRRPQPWDLP